MTVQIVRSFDESMGERVFPMLKFLDDFYPGFETWYRSKVIPGFASTENVLLLASDGDAIVGVALGKKTQDETKLRCVRVTDGYQNTGLGIRLIDQMISVLECEKPACTVSEEMLHAYSRAFVNRYGFQLSQVDKGLYRKGKLEYIFN